MKMNMRLAVTGLLGGLANGLFGAGGGLFLVPLLIRWAKLDTKKAFATSVSIVLPLSIVSAIIYYLKGAVNITEALPYLIGGFLGGMLSGRLFRHIPVTILRKIFGLFIIYGGIRAILNL